MTKIILIPDSFKGTMSSAEICSIMAGAVQRHFPEASVRQVPVADGGEGSVEAFLQAVGGGKVFVSVKGPYFEDMEAFYGVLPDGTAIVEMASCAGLPLVGENRRAEKATTYGVGQLVRHALAHGCKKIAVALGGSATNDGGCGAAAAMGAVFRNAEGEPFIPVGETLADIASVDLSELRAILGDAEVIAMCDVDNPLCGPNGAARVFAPQKGADESTAALLDEGLAHMARVVERECGKDLLILPGAGAAGGMGGGMAAFFGGRLQSGIDTVLELIGFDRMLKDADLVFSGEGKLDSQSLRGKTVIGVARRTKKAGVPLIAVVGDVGDGTDAVYDLGVSAVFSINRLAVPYSEARLHAKSDLALTMDNICRLLKL